MEPYKRLDMFVFVGVIKRPSKDLLLVVSKAAYFFELWACDFKESVLVSSGSAIAPSFFKDSIACQFYLVAR